MTAWPTFPTSSISTRARAVLVSREPEARGGCALPRVTPQRSGPVPPRGPCPGAAPFPVSNLCHGPLWWQRRWGPLTPLAGAPGHPGARRGTSRCSRLRLRRRSGSPPPGKTCSGLSPPPPPLDKGGKTTTDVKRGLGRKKKKRNPNKETFLFNPEGYFLALGSLGKAVRRAGAGPRGKGRASPVPSRPFPPRLARSPRGRYPLGKCAPPGSLDSCRSTCLFI